MVSRAADSARHALIADSVTRPVDRAVRADTADHIASLQIANSQVLPEANIEGTKIVPDFGDGDIRTLGSLHLNGLTKRVYSPPIDTFSLTLSTSGLSYVGGAVRITIAGRLQWTTKDCYIEAAYSLAKAGEFFSSTLTPVAGTNAELVLLSESFEGSKVIATFTLIPSTLGTGGKKPYLVQGFMALESSYPCTME
jgi:hypothetical protein